MTSPDDFEQVFPSAKPQGSSWNEGDCVLAPWEPNFLYAGVIAQIEGVQILVDYDKGESGWVLIEQLKRCEISPGQKILSRRKSGSAYFPAEVLEVQHEKLRVRFNADRSEDWTSISSVRIPCEPNGPAAVPLEEAERHTFQQDIQQGDRVWVPWGQGVLFAGTVSEVKGDEAHVHFDDGEKGWVRLDQLDPLDIQVGLRVMGRWKMGTQFYPGTVTQVQGERIHIQYDDGDKEWTKPAALALPAQAGGLGPQPTTTGSWGSGIKGWMIPLALGLLIAFLRASCR